MRIRRKPWAREELENCEFFVQDPCKNIGSWHDKFKIKNPIHLELGCGKGTFIAKLASKTPIINFLAVDIKSEMLGLAKRNIEKEYLEKQKPTHNILIMSQEIEIIQNMLNREDVIDRIYINFCNPWPKHRQNKKRLTHQKQLQKYKIFLKNGGEIYFKTDDDDLFEKSITYFEEEDFEIIKTTYDLHNEEDFWDNIMTEHEEMFSHKGIKIKALIAKLKGGKQVERKF